MAHVSANVINDAFRLYDDDVVAAITAQTPLAASNTNATLSADTKFHIAMLATETAGGSANNYTFRVEYNLNGGGWLDVTSTTPIKATTPTNCTTIDASGYGSSSLSTGATIQATEYDSDGGDSAGVSLSSSSFEITSCLTIDGAQVADADTIQLRLSNAGLPLDADTRIVTITVSKVTGNVYTPSVTTSLSRSVSSARELFFDRSVGASSTRLVQSRKGVAKAVSASLARSVSGSGSISYFASVAVAIGRTVSTSTAISIAANVSANVLRSVGSFKGVSKVVSTAAAHSVGVSRAVLFGRGVNANMSRSASAGASAMLSNGSVVTSFRSASVSAAVDYGGSSDNNTDGPSVGILRNILSEILKSILGERL